MTDAVITAIEHPVVDVIGHPTGRMLLKREPRYASTSRRSIDAAAANGVALEINSQADRLDLSRQPRAARPRSRRAGSSSRPTRTHAPRSRCANGAC